MINKLILMIVLFLVISFPIASAQFIKDTEQSASTKESPVNLPSGEIAKDADLDRVCDETSEKLKVSGYIVAYGCFATKMGDLCANTPKNEVAYTDDERSGCSDSQLAGINNYWSVDIITDEQRPLRVNLNWLTDQTRGVDVYVPVIFKRNPDFNDENVEFGSATFYCTSERGYGTVTGGPYPDVDFNKNNIEKKYTLQINLRQLREEEAKGNNILDKGLLGWRDLLGSKDPKVLGAILLECESNIYQVKKNPDGSYARPVIPHEKDNFKILIPLQRLAIQPPDVALQAGIDFTENLVERIDKITPALEKARKLTLYGCIGAILTVLAAKTLNAFGLDFFGDISDFIWFGWSKDYWKDKGGFTKELAKGFNTNSFFISGRAMCGYSVCPASWCRYLQQNTTEMMPIKEIKDGKEIIAGQRLKTKLDKLNEMANLFKVPGMPEKQVTPQDSLILSTVCGCISGIELNLLRIRALANEWNRCLRIAKTTDVYVSYCDEKLNKYICQYVAKEIKTFYAMDMVGDAFRWIWRGGGKVEEGEPTGPAEKEASEAGSLIGGVKKSGSWMRDSAEEAWKSNKLFFEQELKDVGTGQAGGNMGYYTNADTELMLCEVAMYRRLPQLDVFERFGLNKNAWETTIAGEWKSEAAYRAMDNKVIRSYSISWTVIAGSDSFPYEVYLKNDAGARRILGSGMLPKAGDLKADYIEITDEIDYSLLCVDVNKEIYRTRCFPPGQFSQGGPLPSFGEEQKDSDSDRLPDEWEKKYNCDKERVSAYENERDETKKKTIFIEEKDYLDCKKLTGKGKENKLDPNKADSSEPPNGKPDWQENPDGDIYTNYDEFEKDYNPNVADEDTKGKSVNHKCWISNKGEIKLSDGVNYNDIDKYKQGDVLGLRINGFVLGTGNGASATENDVVAKIEVYGPDAYYKLLGRKTIDEIENGINWDIPNERNGFYNIKLSYETKSGTFSYESCVLVGTNGEVSNEKNILIYDSANGNCVDSDSGRLYTTKGICVDPVNNLSPNVDSCNGIKLTEYYCESNSCQSMEVDCKGSCGNGVCPEGV